MNKKSNRDPAHIQMDIVVGQNIRFMRTVKGMTLQRVADHCSVAFQQIQKYEKGSNGLSVFRLTQLAQLFEAPLQGFFDPEYIKKMHAMYSDKFFNKGFTKPREFLDVYTALNDAAEMMDQAKIQDEMKYGKNC